MGTFTQQCINGATHACSVAHLLKKVGLIFRSIQTQALHMTLLIEASQDYLVSNLVVIDTHVDDANRNLSTCRCSSNTSMIDQVLSCTLMIRCIYFPNDTC